MSITRIECRKCGAECMEQELVCWRCGARLREPEPAPEPEPTSAPAAPEPAASTSGHIDFGAAALETINAMNAAAATAKKGKRTAVTLTGEVVEVPTTDAPANGTEATQPIAASVGDDQIVGEPPQEVMRLTFCKDCGYQNAEDAIECFKCKRLLEVVAVGSVRDIERLPRAWGFDVLGALWIVLGFAAVFCGQFFIKADPQQTGVTWSDYFWTGIVVCAPGVLIFMRHYFCKLMFWTMTFGSILVWLVIGFLWLFVGLRVNENGQVGLTWLAIFSLLSAFSYFTVRVNDAFDVGS